MGSLRKTIALYVGLIVLLYAAFSLSMLAFSVHAALQIKPLATQAIDEAKQEHLADLQGTLHDLAATTSAAASRQRYAFYLRYVPVYGHDYLFYSDTITAAAELAQAASAVVDQVTPTAGASPLDQLAKIGQAYLQEHQQVSDAFTLLVQAADHADEVHANLIPAAERQQVVDLIAQAKQWQPLLQTIGNHIDALPTLLGVNKPEQILVLLQNPNELRPTGGFLGTYGRITIDHGRVTTFFTDDIYQIQDPGLPQPPDPLHRYLNVDRWYLRDANFSPDFPTAAQQISTLYKNATQESDMDLVVALTPQPVEEFLRLTGPITVDGQTFTPANLVDQIEYMVEQQYWKVGMTEAQRKKIINDLAQVLKDRFFALNASQATSYAQTLQQVLNERGILVYSRDAAIQQQVLAAGWGGEVKPAPADYLYVVDANLGGLKTDRVMDRTIEPRITQRADGIWQEDLRLTYHNTATVQDYRTARYRDYVRIYTPLGSRLISGTGFMSADRTPATLAPTTSTELNKTVFSGFVAVDLGQTRTITLTYALPSWVADRIKIDGRYTLFVQKQPGVLPHLETTLTSQQNLFSFAPSNISYTLVTPKQIRIHDQVLIDRTYTIRLSP